MTVDANEEQTRLANLALFVRVVQAGGISRCAKHVGLDRTTISRRIAALEKYLGVVLFDRIPKNVVVTEAGRTLYKDCEKLLEIAEFACQKVTTGEVPSRATPIVLGAPPDILDSVLNEYLCKFEEEYIGIQVDRYPLSVTDLAQWSRASPLELDLVVAWEAEARRGIRPTPLARVRQSIYASPKYLDRVSIPQSPYDLSGLETIVENTVAARKYWRFDSDGREYRVAVNPTFRVSGMLEARESAIAGLGLACLPDYMCRTSTESFQLVRVLDGFDMPLRKLHLFGASIESYKPNVTMLRLFLEKTLEELILV